MRSLLLNAIVFLALAGSGWGQDISVPAEVKGQPGTFLVIKAETRGTIVRWYSATPGLALFPSELLRDSRTAVVQSGQAGRYTLLAWTAVDGVPSAPAVCVVVIGDAPIPEPGPGPGPGPGPVQGLHVLIVYESNDVSKLPASQRLVLDAKPVRDYLNAACTKDPKWPDLKAWRIWDKDTDASGEAKIWQELLAAKRASVPSIHIRHSKGSHDGPLPGSVADTLSLLKKFGG